MSMNGSNERKFLIYLLFPYFTSLFTLIDNIIPAFGPQVVALGITKGAPMAR